MVVELSASAITITEDRKRSESFRRKSPWPTNLQGWNYYLVLEIMRRGFATHIGCYMSPSLNLRDPRSPAGWWRTTHVSSCIATREFTCCAVSQWLQTDVKLAKILIHLRMKNYLKLFATLLAYQVVVSATLRLYCRAGQSCSIEVIFKKRKHKRAAKSIGNVSVT